MVRARAAIMGALLFGILMSCSGRAGCKGQPGSAPASKKDESPLVAGRVICKEPVWIGVEGGKEGKIHLNATDEQLAKLRATYKRIALVPPGSMRGYGNLFEFDLSDPKQERPATYTLIQTGGMTRETDLFPITIVGITAGEKEEEITVASPYRRPIWEKLPTAFFDIRFCRYPAHAARGIARGMMPSENEAHWCAAVFVAVVDEQRDRLAARYVSIEIRISSLPDLLVSSTEELQAGAITHYVPGSPLSEELDVTLVSITGVTRGGEREPLHLPRDK